MNPDERRKLEADLRTIIGPELQAVGSPLYVLWQSDSGRPTVGMHGFTCPGLAAIYRDELEAAGRWQGIGAAIFICDQFIESHTTPDDSIRYIIATAAHETAHVVSDGIHTLPMTSPQFINQYKIHLERGCDDPDVNWHSFPEGGHDLRFIRCCLHIAARLESYGHNPIVDGLWTGDALFRPHVFAHHLSDELHDLREMTLTEVLATDPPEPFAELYRLCAVMAAERLVSN